jgi:hypothetical protein
MVTHWFTIAEDGLPPEGIVVDTISGGGLQQPLARQGSLWFVPGYSMYVSYSPTMWRYNDEQGQPKP